MISIVIPLLNEVESLPVLYELLLKEVKNIEKNYEIIFVDDGSTDGSLDFLKQIAEKNKAVRIFSFRKNQGKAEALSLGFQKAKGDFVVTMDADLEDNPKELQKFYKKIHEGWDVVSGWRKNRKHSFSRVISSKLSNFIIRVIWGLKLHDYNCGFKIYRKEVVKSIDLYGGLYRFVSLIAYLNGFTVSEIEIVHENRRFGKSKYGFIALWKDLPDVFTMLFLTRYGKRPLHFFGFAGTVLALIGVIILGYLTVIHFQGYAINRRPVLFLGMLLYY
ncbi:MAG: glycosyltransferase family 2 protein [Patescibacteria group bacterium]|nr:glycosyltransferase family 2 protein [Patescibacteria group bacterium]